MNSLNVQKMAASFGLLSFGVLSAGSVLMGATLITGIIRGVAGTIIFGLLIWLSGSLLIREDNVVELEDHEENPEKGKQLDQTA